MELALLISDSCETTCAEFLVLKAPPSIRLKAGVSLVLKTCADLGVSGGVVLVLNASGFLGDNASAFLGSISPAGIPASLSVSTAAD